MMISQIKFSILTILIFIFRKWSIRFEGALIIRCAANVAMRGEFIALGLLDDSLGNAD